MKKLNYVIIFVSDMKRSVVFYRDVLGLPLKFESPGWSEFANEGTTIALHPAAGDARPRGEARNPAGTCDLGFTVEDLDVFHRLMESRGVQCLLAPKFAQDAGTRLARYADPDGLPISVGESAKNQPS